MKLSNKEISEILGEIYLAQQVPHGEKSQKFTKIGTKIKQLIVDADKRHKQNLEPVKHALIVLLELLDNGTVAFVWATEEERDSFYWAKDRLRYRLDHWDEL